jgi:hypothetical protein
MGYQNVQLVFAHWTHLPDRPFRLLTFMALKAQDDERMFWAGREACAVALGRMTPPEPGPDDKSKTAHEYRKLRHANFEAVRNATQPLLETNAIWVVQASSPFNNAKYLLNLAARTPQAEPAEHHRRDLRTPQAEPAEHHRRDLPPNMNPPTGGNSINTTERSNSSQSGTSPGVDDLDYAEASKFLHTLPDFGQSYLERIAEEVGGLKERVIAAALLAMSERNSA